MKNDRGEITIPMVIVGIVLIIMVGICIFMLTGENGLFVPKTENKAQENEVITNNTIDTEKQNVTENENGALTVPME